MCVPLLPRRIHDRTAAPVAADPLNADQPPVSATAVQTLERPAELADREMFVEIVGVRRTILRALRLFLEAVVVPTLLLTILLPTAGLIVGLAAALGWCYLTVLVRWIRGRRLPGTMMLCV